MPRPQPTPYARLGHHLAVRSMAGEARATLTFAEIEAISGRPLPASSRRRGGSNDWWRGDGGQVHAWDGWLRHGWRVAAVDLAGETVTFARGRA